MFERAARELGLDLARTAVIGDRASDMEAATRIGALRVLVGGFDEPMPEVDHRGRRPAGRRPLAADQGLRASAISE